ncbi:GntR family transcriptional regulator [Dactylosporangium roseum]|uniref:GntR family transcriptional regulator n=1 Tax=Dactylosporangium roseum TaxID=47989 RepID=A0ABY5ZAZ2_9ACTN|nr:GntR family transcriptional regulator [Dactylosporangium roseum]UWZ39204.1 GntR family transcriptional regulator [Dactylosporangium roseum]
MVDTAYAHIRDRIITLDLAPGSPLNEEGLMRDAGVGRTPVRNALQRLAMERMVVIHPRRGSFVAEISLSDERWLTELRLPLEGVAARLAATRATDSEREQMRRVCATPLDGRTPHDLLAVDATAHRLIYRSTHNPHLEATLNLHFNLGLRIWHHIHEFIPDLTKHVADELTVLGHVAAGDAAAAQDAAEAHLVPTVSESTWIPHAAKRSPN